ncbi:hypothetical protein ACPDHD_16375 [Myroides odoratimimus]|uniref:hypothetical protein n=1 Tax=Myroides odoratimimus TaxID=76832 RepID=UPI003D2F29B5
MNGKVLVLTEGSNEIGLGHIGRVNSLLSVFRKEQFEIEWYIKGGQTIDLGLDEKVLFVEWDQESFLNVMSSYTYFIIDTYVVSKDFLKKVIDLGKNTLFIIDSKLSYCDSEINPNVFTLFASAYAQKDIVSSKVNFIGGVDYILFKEEFYQAEIKNVLSIDIELIVVNIGGFYEEKFINEICRVINNVFKGISVYVLGKCKSRKSNMFYSKMNKFHFLFLENKAYVDILNQSDLIICNGGQSINEAIFLNKPSIVIKMADNQTKNIEYWADLGVINYIGSKDDGFLMDKLSSELIFLKSIKERDKLLSFEKVKFSSNVKKSILNQFIQ